MGHYSYLEAKVILIKIWDIQTGGVVRTFRSGTHQASIISISPDDLTIASGSRKGEIRLWGVRTGKGRCITKIFSEPRAVCFFPTIPGSLMSVSSPGKIQQWDINGKKIGTRMFGYGFAFSLDGSRFVMCGQLTSPTLRDPHSGTIISILRSPCQVSVVAVFPPVATLLPALPTQLSMFGTSPMATPPLASLGPPSPTKTPSPLSCIPPP